MGAATTIGGGEDVVISELPSDAAVASDSVSELAARLAGAWARFEAHGLNPLDNYDVDEANILNRWLFHHAEHPGLIRLPTGDDLAPDWLALARQALMLTEAQLAVEDVSVAETVVAAEGASGIA